MTYDIFSYFSTPRKEYEEDYEEDDGETFETPNQTGNLQRTPIPGIRFLIQDRQRKLKFQANQ